MTEVKLEIERRFLLTSNIEIPERMKPVRFHVIQYYGSDGYRYRVEHYSRKSLYFKTKKKTLRLGVNDEDEVEITALEYKQCKILAQRTIAKIRRTFYINQPEGTVKWFIDEFESGLVIAEAEMPSEGFDLRFPDCVGEVIDREITGDKTMSNYSMAKNLTI